ncbi:hypothetical protein U9M48_034737 [Paspalum notatum var. saurae]|uniref:Protein kinase domain-containing protein n=1 Tax=Paspalum notatum var. saurae TaxID=547442 RepID=A0AAQ3UDS5_PASNO
MGHILVLVVAAWALLIQQQAAIAEEQHDELRPITLPGCPDKCGDISIPFPFGMIPGCFREGFDITCNHSFQPPRAFLAYREGSPIQATTFSFFSVNKTSGNYSLVDKANGPIPPVELIDISVAESDARAYGPVAFVCNTNATGGILMDTYTSMEFLVDSPEGPFLVSPVRNVLVGVGVEVQPSVSKFNTTGDRDDPLTSCSSTLNGDLQLASNGSCTGRGCCQASLPGTRPLTGVTVSMPPKTLVNNLWVTNPCSFAMVVQNSWYNFSTADLYGDTSNRFPRGVPYVIDFAIRNASCPAKGQQPPPGYACVSGNSSCADVTNGYICKCLEHYEGNPYIPNGCQGVIGGFFVMAALLFVILLRKEKKKMREFYEKNGGPLLEKANMIKIFKKEDLKEILKTRNLIGAGNFGEVYKVLLDNKLVAVKKPKTGKVEHNEQFANEVIIQSQVIHKNIVRLIGCCLEVDIPMLVYEFVTNGNLEDILHNNNAVPLNMDVRLSIASQSADGLAYMHSRTSNKILHGDVKPANILLDDNFMPKISDFGISRLIARDKEHAEYVIGDLSYMDPVYKETGLLTEKSDVYSFGVVILELISRKRSTYYNGNNILVSNFLEAHKEEKQLIELFDNEIADTSNLELLYSLAKIAVECLNLDVDQRPSMMDVAHRLLLLNRLRNL